MSFLLSALLLLQTAAAPSVPAPLRIKLPYSCGSVCRCTQGNHGALTHSNGVNDFAYDFEMNEGTPVLSAAAGRVLRVIQDYDAAKPATSASPYGNLVWIDHGAARFSLYCHLQAGLAPVQEGQLVDAGQLIGLSGNTGNTTGPHLHFCLTDALWRSIPSRFVDVEGDGIPVAMKTYKSGNDGRDVSWIEEDSTLPLDVFAGEGIQLTSSKLPVNVDADAAYLILGRSPKSTGALRLFITKFGQPEEIAGKTIPVSYGTSGSFQFWFQVPEFSKALVEGGQYSLGLAPIGEKGKYWCKNMVSFTTHQRELDDQGRSIQRLRMPFAAGEQHRYRRVMQRSDPVVEDMIAFSTPDGSSVVSSAAGRVIAVGLESEYGGGGASAGSSAAYVILDHGDGFTTEYAGLAPKSIAVREGALVQAGWRLGASTQSLFSFEPGFVYSMCAQSGCDTVPRFAELGEDGFLDEGEVVARAPAASAPVFRADSRVGETTFLENGIQSASGVPAHAFHVAEHYSIQGELDGSESRVAFVARRRGQAQPSVRVSGIVHEGTFSLSVCLADRRKDLADGAWEWALTAAAEHVTTSHWEPLTLLW